MPFIILPTRLAVCRYLPASVKLAPKASTNCLLVIPAFDIADSRTSPVTSKSVISVKMPCLPVSNSSVCDVMSLDDAPLVFLSASLTILPITSEALVSTSTI